MIGFSLVSWAREVLFESGLTSIWLPVVACESFPIAIPEAGL